jgi:ribA/ribD-fused uncharacterized protein
MKMWAKKRLFKNLKMFLSEDFPKEIVAKRRTLLPVLKAAMDQDKEAFFNVDKLVIDRVTYTVDTMKKLPKELQPCYITTKINSNAVAFFNELSPLSNFHHCEIKKDSATYYSSEQRYQYRKADYVGDEVRSYKIMQAETPHECKRLGDQVNTDDTDWHTVQLDIMKECLIEKFSQNENLKNFLLQTGTRQLGEASKDRFWGTGESLGSVNVLNTTYWQGDNHLGQLLMQLRDSLT